MAPQPSQEGSWEGSWAVLGGSWAALGGSWALFGGSWGAFGASWGGLGLLLGAFLPSWNGLGGPLIFIVYVYCCFLHWVVLWMFGVDFYYWCLLLMLVMDLHCWFYCLLILLFFVVDVRCWLLMVLLALLVWIRDCLIDLLSLFFDCVLCCWLLSLLLCWCHSNPYCWILSSLLIIVFILIVSFWVVLECESLIQFIDSIQWCDSSIRFVHWVEVWFYIMPFTPFDSTTPPGGMREAIK